MTNLRWIIDGYEEWLAREGVPIVSGLAVNPLTVETKPWARLGADGAFIHLDSRGDYLSTYVCDLAPGTSTERQRHLFEEVVFVLDGQGSTVVELPGGATRSFEWGRGSLFSLPLNMPYRHLNASGLRRARLACVTDLPLIMKLFRNERFVFDTPFHFSERFGEERYLRGEGTFFKNREHRHMWETNFVADLLCFDQLQAAPGRGRGSSSIMFVLADGTIHAHLSEIPSGDYKRAHYHDEGYHIFQLSGDGYSLYWNKGEPAERVDWSYGLLHAPSARLWHQHFNVSDEPARYLAVQFGSLRYPILRAKAEIWQNRNYEAMAAAGSASTAFQIDYADEDPAIRQLFEAERAKATARSAQPAR